MQTAFWTKQDRPVSSNTLEMLTHSCYFLPGHPPCRLNTGACTREERGRTHYSRGKWRWLQDDAFLGGGGGGGHSFMQRRAPLCLARCARRPSTVPSVHHAGQRGPGSKVRLGPRLHQGRHCVCRHTHMRAHTHRHTARMKEWPTSCSAEQALLPEVVTRRSVGVACTSARARAGGGGGVRNSTATSFNKVPFRQPYTQWGTAHTRNWRTTHQSSHFPAKSQPRGPPPPPPPGA
jgi:hypothetical protein